MSDWYITYEGDEDLGHIVNDSAGIDMTMQFQHDPVGENGINGVQNEEVLDLLAERLRHLNARFPCRENSIAITKVEEAALWLRHRTALRFEQGVEGKNEPHVS